MNEEFFVNVPEHCVLALLGVFGSSVFTIATTSLYHLRYVRRNARYIK